MPPAIQELPLSSEILQAAQKALSGEREVMPNTELIASVFAAKHSVFNRRPDDVGKWSFDLASAVYLRTDGQRNTQKTRFLQQIAMPFRRYHRMHSTMTIWPNQLGLSQPCHPWSGISANF
jgi:hypothetical protein